MTAVIGSIRPAAATPAGETCFIDAATGARSAVLAARTNCQPCSASSKFTTEGTPPRTENGNGPPSGVVTMA
jgi:hypothetical protein